MRAISRNHQGVTLIELIVVIAIVSITVGLASISISLIYSRDAEDCAKRIDAQLEQVRMNSMSQTGNFVLFLSGSDHRAVVQRTRGTDRTEAAEQLPDRVTLTFENADSVLADIVGLWISFDKSNGRVVTMETVDTTGTRRDLTSNIVRIVCTNDRNTNKVATVVLIRRTGKHYVEYR